MEQKQGGIYPNGMFDALAVLNLIASSNIVRDLVQGENLTFVTYFPPFAVDPPPPYSPDTQPAPIGFQSPPPAGAPPPLQQQQPVSVTVYQPEPVTTTNVVVMAPTCPACQVSWKTGLVIQRTHTCGRLLMSH